MIKWAAEDFDRERLEVARVYMGSFGFWVVQGVKSNRILYAMKKRGELSHARCVVVEPPPPRETGDGDDDTFQDSWGTDFGKIQLIP
eukprot:CAMPEP_0179324112 /NCGR_PEP_ID=MMETSP0797-20121207/60099_1 /TAXON_ID=47934 /ORGANISM="Dinophysis acuminata, Strain DAEP01" /LENGTH=86 /DNA_ID=CAMNT_0021036037 /DNA_START=65 /DNA_END=325 /DNA_ORIENTATION=-